MVGEMEWLRLFAEADVFILLFMEIMIRIGPFRRAIHRQATWLDKIILVLLFGGFSIFGTYVGIPLPSGAIINIRDLGPMVAGLVGGPLVGLGAGLIGGIHRYFMGGFTAIPCGLATVLAGLICGGVYHIRRGKLVGFLPAMILAALIECFHGVLTLLIARPFADAVGVVKTAIPAMIAANSLGMAIAILLTGDSADRKEGA